MQLSALWVTWALTDISKWFNNFLLLFKESCCFLSSKVLITMNQMAVVFLANPKGKSRIFYDKHILAGLFMRIMIIHVLSLTCQMKKTWKMKETPPILMSSFGCGTHSHYHNALEWILIHPLKSIFVVSSRFSLFLSWKRHHLPHMFVVLPTRNQIWNNS